MVHAPSDLGYDDTNFILPPVNYHNHIINAKNNPINGMLFPLMANTLNERRGIRRESTNDRAEFAAEIANKSNEQMLIWCDMNNESALLKKLVDGAVEVTGSDTIAHKESAMMDFIDGNIKILVSKPKICGYGMNYQCCHNMAFVGLSDSWEMFYQAVRRCWRFGQKSPVDVHIITHELEGAVLNNIKRKDANAQRMAQNMIKHMADISSQEIRATVQEKTEYQPTKKIEVPQWM